jgi:hypothetical protein
LCAIDLCWQLQVHVKLLDESTVSRDVDIQPGEDKLKLRCPAGHKVRRCAFTFECSVYVHSDFAISSIKGCYGSPLKRLAWLWNLQVGSVLNDFGLAGAFVDQK